MNPILEPRRETHLRTFGPRPRALSHLLLLQSATRVLTAPRTSDRPVNSSTYSSSSYSYKISKFNSDHINRKHTSRFVCPTCSDQFHLRADMKRHLHTVHKDTYRANTTYSCKNVQCAMEGKEWTRKDHFLRHVGRCDKRKLVEGQTIKDPAGS
jgi:predicted RNA-binding Zn-ribbon protein involved in translation (DUF1610 family)